MWKQQYLDQVHLRKVLLKKSVQSPFTISPTIHSLFSLAAGMMRLEIIIVYLKTKQEKKIHIMLSHFDPPHHHPFVSWFKVDKFCWGRRRVALISTGLVCFFYGGMGSFFSLYRVGLTNVGIGRVVPSNLTKPSHQTVLIRQAVAELEMSEVFT